jgi:ABC-type uncharacterized transport system ATPase component
MTDSRLKMSAAELIIRNNERLRGRYETKMELLHNGRRQRMSLP